MILFLSCRFSFCHLRKDFWRRAPVLRQAIPLADLTVDLQYGASSCEEWTRLGSGKCIAEYGAHFKTPISLL